MLMKSVVAVQPVLVIICHIITLTLNLLFTIITVCAVRVFQGVPDTGFQIQITIQISEFILFAMYALY